jgi:hypothetical protein
MKSKKVLTILLSLAIMVTFMPSFAFAATDTGEFNADHSYIGSTEEELVAPTCDTPGIVVVNCTRDNGLCSNTFAKGTEAEGHHYVEKRFDSAEDYLAELIDQGYFYEHGYNGNVKSAGDDPDVRDAKAAERAAQWMVRYGDNVCYGYADVCSKCGALRVAEEIKEEGHYAGLTVTEHKEPEGTKDCAASFTCDICKKADMVNSKHNLDTQDTYHNTPANVTVAPIEGKYCTKKIKVGDDYVETWVALTGTTCKECKQVVKVEATVSDANGESNVNIAELSHHLVETVTEEATCEHPGTKVKACDVCGYVDTESSIPKVDHDFSVEGSVDATYALPAYTYKACKFCGLIDENSIKFSGKPLATKDDFSLEVIREKTCDQDGIIKVTETYGSRIWTYYMTYDRSSKKYVDFFDNDIYADVFTTDKDYFLGFYGELDESNGIEIPDIKATGHKWAKSAKVADATCTVPEQEAMKCSICGEIKHPTVKVGKALGHTVKEVVVPETCGAIGYTYKVCTTCNCYLQKDTKTGNTTDPGIVVAGDVLELPEGYIYNEKKPVVELGTECNFEWKVTKAATDTTDGEKALVCTKCGAVKAGSETVIPADVATAEKKAAVEAATPAIEAAADVIDSNLYTAKSVAAVKEAKDMLNAAIASGSAADVKAMTEKLQNATQAAVKKSDNTIKVTGKKVKATANKKTKKVTKKQTFKKSKAFKVKGAKGAVTFKKTSGNKKITVAKNGTITVNKGIKKGTYKVGVTATAAGNGNYLSGTADATVTVVIK